MEGKVSRGESKGIVGLSPNTTYNLPQSNSNSTPTKTLHHKDFGGSEGPSNKGVTCRQPTDVSSLLNSSLAIRFLTPRRRVFHYPLFEIAQVPCRVMHRAGSSDTRSLT